MLSPLEQPPGTDPGRVWLTNRRAEGRPQKPRSHLQLRELVRLAAGVLCVGELGEQKLPELGALEDKTLWDSPSLATGRQNGGSRGTPEKVPSDTGSHLAQAKPSCYDANMGTSSPGPGKPTLHTTVAFPCLEAISAPRSW